ncbi:MAG: ribonucleoside triphosphate reductase [Thermotogota bacterium]|nr:ribonucleoside triphosphate reductase [Thermotogota bacterium]
MLGIKKRDGKIVDFEIDKIQKAIRKAFDATESAYNEDILQLLSLRAVSKSQSQIKDQVIDIEKLQDNVEDVLEESGFTEVAKAYIIYRKQHQNLRELSKDMLNFSSTVNDYLEKADWRVKENSTVSYSIGGLILHNSGTVIANYWLNELYDEEIGRAHKNGDLHIHDLSMLSGYCAGWSLRQLIEKGLGGVTGKITSAPAKHLSTLSNQIVNFLGVLQNEWAGAQAFSSFDTYLAPFVKTDNLSYKETKQAIQSFVFGVNTPSRWGTQSPFSNITLDWVVPEDLQNLPAIAGGKPQEFTYGDCQTEMNMINRAFIEVMLEGDYAGRGFQYPIPTYNITRDFDWENENVPLLFEMTSKYGTPYFQNFINSELNPSDVRSMCCRLQLDKRELRRRGGGLFGSDEFTGSIGVVTLNLPRMAYLSENEDAFFQKLEKYMEIAKRSLEIKRSIIEKLNNFGLYPYTKHYLKDFNNHFSTIGLVGMNEACLNAKWLNKTIDDKDALGFSKKVLDTMRERLADFQEETGNLYNLEATPAESTSYRLAKHDKKRFSDIITAGVDTPYYTNSSHLPVNFTEDMFEALDIQETLQTKYTGGTVFHAFLGERVQDWETAKSLVQKIAENYRIPYFTISPTYSICPDHGYISGEVYTCPICGKPTETYSRITGYYRPVQHWNNGKQQEFKQRETYSLKEGVKDEIRRNRETESNRLSEESSNDGIYIRVQL